MVLTRFTSVAESSMFEGKRSTPSTHLIIPSFLYNGLSNIIFSIFDASVAESSSGCLIPNMVVKFPCESASISKTFLLHLASPTPKLIVVVDLPTPPFWFANAIVFIRPPVLIIIKK